MQSSEISIFDGITNKMRKLWQGWVVQNCSQCLNASFQHENAFEGLTSMVVVYKGDRGKKAAPK